MRSSVSDMSLLIENIARSFNQRQSCEKFPSVKLQIKFFYKEFFNYFKQWPNLPILPIHQVSVRQSKNLLHCKFLENFKILIFDRKSPGWKKIRTTVQISSAISSKKPLKRQDSFIVKYTTRY